jgi:hypothetical protein
MATASNTRRRQNVPNTYSPGLAPLVVTRKDGHNNFGGHKAVEAVIPKTSAEGFDPKPLETFSLPDFVDLLEVAGMMPTGDEKVLSPEEVATTPLQFDWASLDRLRQSRFRFLMDHLRPNDPKFAPTDVHAMAGLITFLHVLHSLFFHVLALKRHETESGQSLVPVADYGQSLFTAFTLTMPIAWSVSERGRLVRRPFPAERDTTHRLVERLLKVFEGADPARIRRCAFAKCGRVFYAKRIDQLCCSRRCNNNRIQREWYKEHGKSAVYARAGGKNKR